MDIQKLIVIFFIIVLMYVVYLIIKGIVSVIRKNMYKKTQKKEQEQIALMDKFLKPAEISYKAIQKPLRETIKKYIYAKYNDNKDLLPKNIGSNLYEVSIKNINRDKELGVKRILEEYTPSKNFEIMNSTSAVYIVSELIMKAKYTIKVSIKHSTFSKIEIKEIEQDFVFTGTNNEGWILNSVGPENIKNLKEYDN